tara:strand:+ start:339 stop:1268 length:930 start_codon:yes stop_codon:yes gene_type:complete
MTTIVFPGQGSQFIGMSKDFYDNFNVSKETFEIIEDSTKINLKKIIFENDKDLLNITQYTQISIFCASMAIFNVLKNLLNEKGITINFMLGHSLGEYSALAASNVFSLADCSKLLKIRGELMQNAYKENESGMAAVIGINCSKLEDIISNNKLDIEIANDNSPSQVVVSGIKKELVASENILLKNGVKKFIHLNVSAAFHSKIMKSAEKKLMDFLESVKFNKPICNIISNYSGKNTLNPNHIFLNLSNQMSNKVRWVDSINTLDSLNEKKIIEIGPGKVLSNLIKRISNNFDIININEINDYEKLINEL